MADRLDVAVVGAGPFGLSVAAHLLGHRVRTFGEEMETWRRRMPRDMLLRSAWEETSLAAPGRAGTIDAWARATGAMRSEPIPLELFLDYAGWFAHRFAGDRDPHDVARIERSASGSFRLTTAAGAELDAAAVVLAVGVVPFAYVPPALALPSSDGVMLATGDPADADRLAGRRVLVVGGGQAGLESAGLAARAGATVELVTRSSIHWFSDREPHNPRGPLGQRLYRLAYPAVGYGPPPLNRLVLHPDIFAHLPSSLKRRLTARLLRPGGSPWLRPLVEGTVSISERCTVVALRPGGGALRATLSDGGEREVDTVLVACGYRFDLARLGFLSPELRARIEVRHGWPVLDRLFRSTLDGLFFVGYPAEGRYGPISRFVLGTEFTASRVSMALPG